jgi:D-3-phosphoglycerate dehydrogenase
MALLTVDSKIPANVLETVKSEIGATAVREIDLED